MADTPNHWTPGAAEMQCMTDDQFVVAWHEAVVSGDEERLELIEGSARHRFQDGSWKQAYARQFPAQTRYQLSE